MRRYAESEQENTNPQANIPKQPASNEQDKPPARLYPDLIGNQPGPQNSAPFIPSVTPFVPFGPNQPLGPNSNHFAPGFHLEPPPNHHQQQQRTSESFSSGLGRRLLNLVGVENNNNNVTDPRALQNTTVLHQLNRGVHSVYDGLSKVYNSTIQQQINLLQERFRSNKTNEPQNPWQQRMSEQMPIFFKSMADRVGAAQQRLSDAWRKFKNANASDLENATQTRSTLFGSFDSIMNNNDFFTNLGRSINGAASDPIPNIGPNGEIIPPKRDMVTQLRDFWSSQVKPQVDTVRNMMVRSWHDLTASGAYDPIEPMITSRSDRYKVNSAPPSASSNELMNDILSSVDLNGPEYTLIEAKSDSNKDNAQIEKANTIGSQMQTRLTAMQRDLNQLWTGLTNSLQRTINGASNQRDPINRNLDASASENKDSIDPSINEINSKLQDIARVQSDADKVYEAVQRQQAQQQQQQMRNSFTDRMKNFYNNFDDNVSKWGTAVNDFWHQIPDKWNNFVNNNNNNKKQDSSTSTTSTTTSTTTTPPEK